MNNKALGKKKTIFYTYHLANVLNSIKFSQKNLEHKTSVFYTKYSYKNCLGLLRAGLIHNVCLVSYSSENIKKQVISRLVDKSNKDNYVDKWINEGLVSKRRRIELTLKYIDDAPIIKDIILYTKPSRQIRVSSNRLKQLAELNPGVLFFISTSQLGIINQMTANERGLGGILLYKIL